MSRASTMRLSTPWGACAVLDLVNLLHHELALRFVSSCANPRYVPPYLGCDERRSSRSACRSQFFLVSSCLQLAMLFLTSCRSAFLTSFGPLFSFFSSSTTHCFSCFDRIAQRLSVASHATRHCLFSTSCTPVHVLTHAFSSGRSFTCCAWCVGPEHHSLPPRAARAGLWLQISVAPVVHVHVAVLLWSALAEGLNVDAIELCVRFLRLPSLGPA